MSQALNVKRHEIKFYVSYADYEHARRLLAELMEPDPNQKDPRGYFIRSLYFDDIQDSSVEEKLDGVEKRDKYRIRIYDTAQNWAKLERKRKHNQYVDKSSVTLTKSECYELMDGNYHFLLEKENAAARSIYFDFARKYFRPAVIVDYDREVFILDYNEIRVTFDKKLRVSTSNFDLFDSSLVTQPLQRDDTIIMEVKFNVCLPAWFKNLFSFDGTTAQAISKYCQGRMHLREYYLD